MVIKLISDAGVATLMCYCSYKGGLLNVKINCKDFDDLKFIESINKNRFNHKK